MTNKSKKAIMTLSLGHFMADVYSSGLVPLYPFVASTLGLSLAGINLVISLGHFASTIMQPFWGFLSDKIPHRTFMILGIILGAIFFPLVLFATNKYMLFVCIILTLMGNALYHPQSMLMISLFKNENSDISKNMAFYSGIGIIGYALAPAISSNLITRFGKYSILSIGILGIIVTLLLFLNIPKIPHEGFDKKEGGFWEVMGIIIKDSAILSLFLLAVTKAMLSMVFATYMPFLLKAMGYNLGHIGVIVTMFLLMSGLGTMMSAKIESKFGAKNALRYSIASVLPLTLLFVYLLKVSMFFAIIIFAINGFFIFLSTPIVIVLGQKIFPKYKAVISGFLNGCAWTPASLCLIPLGYMAQNIGIEETFILTSAFGFLVAMFGIGKRLNKILEKC